MTSSRIMTGTPNQSGGGGHTPGPWTMKTARVITAEVSRFDYHGNERRYDKEIAWTQPVQNDAQREANAHLIAAAPDLMEALENAAHRECSSWCDPSLNEHTRYCKANRAALAKARGR